MTAREKEVYGYMILGTPFIEIQKTLGFTKNTMRVHARNICFSFGVKNRTGLLALKIMDLTKRIRALDNQLESQTRGHGHHL